MTGKVIEIAVIGHSVGVTPTGSLEPSDVTQPIMYPNPGKPFPFRRTGVIDEHLDWNSNTAYLGGGKWVVGAAVEEYRALTEEGHTVRITMTGGRPDYLDQAAPEHAGIGEADVMRAYALEFLGEEAPVKAVGGTRTTDDDIRVVFDCAAQDDVERLLLVVMGFRMGRVIALIQKFVAEDPKLAPTADKILVLPAEALFPSREIYRQMYLSEACRRTTANEDFGTRAIVKGGLATTGAARPDLTWPCATQTDPAGPV